MQRRVCLTMPRWGGKTNKWKLKIMDWKYSMDMRKLEHHGLVSLWRYDSAGVEGMGLLAILQPTGCPELPLASFGMNIVWETQTWVWAFDCTADEMVSWDGKHGSLIRWINTPDESKQMVGTGANHPENIYNENPRTIGRWKLVWNMVDIQTIELKCRKCLCVMEQSEMVLFESHESCDPTALCIPCFTRNEPHTPTPRNHYPRSHYPRR